MASTHFFRSLFLTFGGAGVVLLGAIDAFFFFSWNLGSFWCLTCLVRLTLFLFFSSSFRLSSLGTWKLLALSCLVRMTLFLFSSFSFLLFSLGTLKPYGVVLLGAIDPFSLLPSSLFEPWNLYLLHDWAVFFYWSFALEPRECFAIGVLHLWSLASLDFFFFEFGVSAVEVLDLGTFVNWSFGRQLELWAWVLESSVLAVGGLAFGPLNFGVLGIGPSRIGAFLRIWRFLFGQRMEVWELKSSDNGSFGNCLGRLDLVHGALVGAFCCFFLPRYLLD